MHHREEEGHEGSEIDSWGREREDDDRSPNRAGTTGKCLPAWFDAVRSRMRRLSELLSTHGGSRSAVGDHLIRR